MGEGGFYERRRISPTSLAVVILLHGAAITALAMSKMEMPAMKIFTPIKIKNVEVPPDPEPIPEPEPQPEIRPRTQIDYVPPKVPSLPRTDMDVAIKSTPDIPIFNPNPPGLDKPKPAEIPTPPKPPVRTEPQIRSSGALQPPYPASEMRAGVEGRVVIRVTIGADGRVTGATKVSATNDAFYRATERHALRAWRFRPASVDGKPVAGEKVMTVFFRLDD